MYDFSHNPIHHHDMHILLSTKKSASPRVRRSARSLRADAEPARSVASRPRARVRLRPPSAGGLAAGAPAPSKPPGWRGTAHHHAPTPFHCARRTPKEGMAQRTKGAFRPLPRAAVRRRVSARRVRRFLDFGGRSTPAEERAPMLCHTERGSLAAAPPAAAGNADSSGRSRLGSFPCPPRQPPGSSTATWCRALHRETNRATDNWAKSYGTERVLGRGVKNGEGLLD
jgi:hypothetical protein